MMALHIQESNRNENEPGFEREVSPLSKPADRSVISSITQTQDKEIQPSDYS